MNYDYYTGSYNYDGLFGALAGMLAFIAILSLAVAIFGIIVMWKIFKKAGKEGWIAIIPLYNVYTLFEITWGNGWYCLLLLTAIIPAIGWIASAVVTIITMIKLAKAFGKDTGFTVGLVLLSLIFLAILAFDKSTYLGVPTKDGNNITPAGPTPNQPDHQNVGVAPINPNPVIPPQNNIQSEPTISNEINPPTENNNPLEYNAPNQVVNNELNNPEQTVAPIENEVSNENQTISESPLQTSFCTNCGTQLPEGTIFCPNCGTPKAS